jgi:hypothetical protein
LEQEEVGLMARSLRQQALFGFPDWRLESWRWTFDGPLIAHLFTPLPGRGEDSEPAREARPVVWQNWATFFVQYTAIRDAYLADYASALPEHSTPWPEVPAVESLYSAFRRGGAAAADREWWRLAEARSAECERIVAVLRRP